MRTYDREALVDSAALASSDLIHGRKHASRSCRAGRYRPWPQMSGCARRTTPRDLDWGRPPARRPVWRTASSARPACGSRRRPPPNPLRSSRIGRPHRARGPAARKLWRRWIGLRRVATRALSRSGCCSCQRGPGVPISLNKVRVERRPRRTGQRPRGKPQEVHRLGSRLSSPQAV